MRTYITNKHSDYGNQWVRADRANGAVLGAFSTRREALQSMIDEEFGAIVAAVGDGVYTPWEGDLMFEETETSDGRIVSRNGTEFRELPLPLLTQMQTAYGHDGAWISGRIDSVARQGDTITGKGVFDDSEYGLEGARLVEQKIMTGVSADLAASEVEIEVTEVDEDGFPIAILERVLKGEFLGATQVAFPAFAGAQLRLAAQTDTGTSEDDATDADLPDAPVPAPAAIAAAGGPVRPPRSAFAQPTLNGPTAMHIGDQFLFGHIATWGTCHVGRDDICLTAPTSPTDYAYFTTGSVVCDDGTELATGVLTMDTGHADLQSGYAAATAHYDNTGTAIADVAIGEDEWGIWVAGALRPGLRDDQIRAFRAASPSGDWRRIGGSLELIAVLAVNVPGYPVPRARVAGGAELALVAAAAPRAVEEDDITTQLAALQQQVRTLSRRLEPLNGLIAQQLDQRVLG